MLYVCEFCDVWLYEWHVGMWVYVYIYSHTVCVSSGSVGVLKYG